MNAQELRAIRAKEEAAAAMKPPVPKERKKVSRDRKSNVKERKKKK